MTENENTGAAVVDNAAIEETAVAGQEKAVGSDEEFERLIKGPYKDAYARRTQSMINKRFRETKELEAQRDMAQREREERGRYTRAEAALGVAGEYSALIRDAESAKETYPDFDLERECADPRFAKLVAAGLGVKGAYEALHHGEILAGAMQYAADRVMEGAIKGSLAAERPEENGTHHDAAIDPRKNVASLTERDIRDILKRVEKGEKISF